jgi:hypothetical protein
MLNILNYFKNIDYYYFSYNSPNWFLNKNNTTIYLNYIIEDKKEIINLSYLFPYEFYYFFFIIIYLFIYFKTFFYNLILNQIYTIGTTYDKRVLFHLILNKLFWNNSFIFLNWWELVNSSVTNINSPKGLYIAHMLNIYLYTNKYIFIDYLIKYKNNIYLYYNKYYILFYDYGFTIKMKNYILLQKILIWINIFWLVIQIIIKVIYKKYIYILLFIKNSFNNIKINNNIYRINSIYMHYKFKKLLWNNYIKK